MDRNVLKKWENGGTSPCRVRTRSESPAFTLTQKILREFPSCDRIAGVVGVPAMGLLSVHQFAGRLSHKVTRICTCTHFGGNLDTDA